MTQERLAPTSSLVAGLAGLLVVVSCSTLQRIPGPMTAPPGTIDDPPERTGFEGFVLRHSDPVWMLAGNALSGYPLSFYRKRERFEAAVRIRVGGGGTAELGWPGDATSILLFDQTQVLLGDPGRDQPLVLYEDLTRTQLSLTPEDRIVFPGGIELRGDPVQPSGPFLMERRSAELLRARNQSSLPARIFFRGEALELSPGDSIDLPILSLWNDAPPADPAVSQLYSEGITFDVLGRVEPRAAGGAVRLRALESSQLSAAGIRVLLERGEEAIFSSLQGGIPAGWSQDQGGSPDS